MAKGRKRLAPYWRGALISAGLAVALGGCTHWPEWVPWYKPAETAKAEPAVPAVPPSEETRKPHIAHPAPHHTEPPPPPEPQIAMADPDTLVGMKPDAVSKLLGPPANIVKAELSLVWTYSADGCALKVYFYPDLKTSDFHVLKFSLAGAGGKTLDKDDPCRRKLLALKTHDTG